MCCLFQFPTKINFFIFLAKIRIETYFPLGDPNINFFKPLFSSLANTLMSNVIKKRDLLLANSVTFDDKSSNKSLVQVKNKSGPRNQFCAVRCCSLSTTICFILLRKSVKTVNKFPNISYFLCSKINLSYHTSSKALDITKKISLIFNPSSKDLKICG